MAIKWLSVSDNILHKVAQIMSRGVVVIVRQVKFWYLPPNLTVPKLKDLKMQWRDWMAQAVPLLPMRTQKWGLICWVPHQKIVLTLDLTIQLQIQLRISNIKAQLKMLPPPVVMVVVFTF